MIKISESYHNFLREENHILREAVVTLRKKIQEMEDKLDRLRYEDDMANHVDQWEDIPF